MENSVCNSYLSKDELIPKQWNLSEHNGSLATPFKYQFNVSAPNFKCGNLGNPSNSSSFL